MNTTWDNDNAAVNLMWDYNNLYVAFAVKDKDIRGTSIEYDQNLYMYDDVEFYIATRPDSIHREFMGYYDYHFFVNVLNTYAAVRGRKVCDSLGYGGYNRDHTFHTEIMCGGKVYGTLNKSDDYDSLYVVEAAIPWKSIQHIPHSGDTLLMTFHVKDHHRKENITYYLLPPVKSRTESAQSKYWRTFILYDASETIAP